MVRLRADHLWRQALLHPAAIHALRSKHRFEPKLNIRNPRCVRTQQPECCKRVKFGAATHWQNRSFMQTAAKTRR